VPDLVRERAQPPGTVHGVLAVHLLWTDDEGGRFLLWGEDGDLAPSGPPRRGRNPAIPVPRPHPFTASATRLITPASSTTPRLSTLR
jgi:hypothetical protein